MLDQALLRPGRFDRQVTVDRPDVQGRVRVLKVHSRGKSIGKDVDFDKVARRTPGEPWLAGSRLSGCQARVGPTSGKSEHTGPCRLGALPSRWGKGQRTQRALSAVQASQAPTCRT